MVTNGLAIWSGRWAMENWIMNDMPVWAQSWLKPIWEFKRHIQVEHMDAHQMNPLPGWKGVWNQKVDILLHLRQATWIHAVSVHGELQQCQDEGINICFLHFLRPKYEQERQKLQMDMGQIPQRGGHYTWLAHRCQLITTSNSGKI